MFNQFFYVLFFFVRNTKRAVFIYSAFRRRTVAVGYDCV